ncbi:MAG: hypothetical protein F4Y12_07635 [Acidimicrobiaceae bacterium]|nr:hypothetical protein [Acidimicrobiaceae bacterium]MYH79009.1 hypothetical protein [Acidimicrobiaceae bacterium]
MIRPMNRPHSGLAVLVAGALIASILAAGATPAGAVTDRPDHTTRLSVCVGDAVADQLFTDVSQAHVFRDAINCIAYYQITKGTGDGSTYSPNQDVTRAQMAVFIVRAAEAAGVDLGSARDAGFGDIDNTWEEARDAINRLASKEMIPSGGAFRPDDAITRAEMATFLIGLLVEAAPDVTKDSSGTILLGAAGSRSVPDDRFPDASGNEIVALYELGVTKGASAADVQDDTEPPLDLNYEPEGIVNRGQMAAFITRALAHTRLRPEGITAQYDGADVVVSVRDAEFRPVSGAIVDVFWTVAGQADGVLAIDGTCDPLEVIQADRSSFPCEIDNTDSSTGSDGDAAVAVTGLRRVPEGGAVVWVWTGPIGDTLDAATNRYVLEVAEGADVGFASTTLITTFGARKARFGSSVVYSMQLHDIVGKVSTGANGIDPARWSLSVRVPGEDPEVQTLVSGPTGAVAFSISLDDPTPGTVDGDRTVMYTLTAIDNAPPIVNTSGQPAASGQVVFSDEASSIAQGRAIVTIDTGRYVHVTGGVTGNTATVTVLDQYGNPFPGARVSLSSSGLSDVTLDGSAEFRVNSRGSHRFSYRSSGPGGETETLTAGFGVSSASEGSETATVYWAADAGEADSGSVLAGDARSMQIVVDDGDGPVMLVFDDNDRFNLGGQPTTITLFQAELAEALKRDNPGLELEWSNYRARSERRVTEYSLT